MSSSSSSRPYSSTAFCWLLKLRTLDEDEAAALTAKHHCVHPVLLSALTFQLPRAFVGSATQTLFEWQEHYHATNRLAPEGFARLMFRHLLLGLEFLHSSNLCFGAVAPNTCLYRPSDGCVVLSDYSGVFSTTQLTPSLNFYEMHTDYLAPELRSLCRDPNWPTLLTDRVDSWSVALTVHDVVLGQALYTDPAQVYLYSAAALFTRQSRYRTLYSGLRTLLEQMLLVEPSERLSVSEALSTDPWLNANEQTPASQ